MKFLVLIYINFFRLLQFIRYRRSHDVLEDNAFGIDGAGFYILIFK